MKTHIPGGGIVETAWQGDRRLTLTMKTTSQTLVADVEIDETIVSGTVKIPMMLSKAA